MRRFSAMAASAAFFTLASCGTTYELPELADSQKSQAQNLFIQAQQEPARKPISDAAAEARFKRVAARVKPVAEQACRDLTAARGDVDCDVSVEIDHRMKVRNAYFTFDRDGEPVVRFTLPILKDSRNDDEIAFIMGHEYGHLIGDHIAKQQQQMLAGALIMGVAAAAATSYGGGYGGTAYDQQTIESAVLLGAGVGQIAYSQSYELESDTIGTRIAAQAGYDPILGAKFFARPEPKTGKNGQLSFWGTHPPDAKRVATVIATVEQIEANIALKGK